MFGWLRGRAADPAAAADATASAKAQPVAAEGTALVFDATRSRPTLSPQEAAKYQRDIDSVTRLSTGASCTSSEAVWFVGYRKADDPWKHMPNPRVEMPDDLTGETPGFTADEAALLRATIFAGLAQEQAVHDRADPKAVSALVRKLAAQRLYTEKGALRRAFPNGHVQIEPLHYPLMPENFLGYTQIVYIADKITIKPGRSADYVAVRATVHKPTAETKLGVTMSEGAKQGPPPPAGLIFRNEQSNELLPKLTGLGALEGSGLMLGDEIVWVNDEEVMGPVQQCASLLRAAVGDVNIIARRRRA